MFNKYEKREKIDPDKLAICGRCKNEFYKSNMRQCPHPVVRELCGEWICVYDCMRCSFSKKASKSFGLYICTYK